MGDMPIQQTPTRVLLVDDHTLFREALRALLETRSDYEVVGEAEDGLEALELAERFSPDMILMDVAMPRMDGLEATQCIRQIQPNIVVVILTVSDNNDQVLEALRQGAQGYLLKDIDSEAFFDLLNRARRGEVAISGQTAAKMLGVFRASPSKRPSASHKPNAPLPPLPNTLRPSTAEASREHRCCLSNREKEALRYLARGCSNKEIAEALSLAPSTVKAHLRSIMAKLQLRNRTECAIYAVHKGLLDG